LQFDKFSRFIKTLKRIFI